MPFKPFLSARRNFQGLPFCTIWSERLGQVLADTVRADIWWHRGYNTGNTPHSSLVTCHSEIASHHLKTYYSGIFWWLWWIQTSSVSGPRIPHKLLTSSHTQALSTEYHPLFPTRWCSGSNSPLYNITTSKLISGPGLTILLRAVPDFSSKLALVRFRREKDN